MILGRSSFAGGLLAAVAVMIATGCSKDPQTAKREYVRSGDAYAAKKQFKQAVIQYRNAVQVDAKFGEAREKLADAYFQLGAVENAVAEVENAIRRAPDRSASYSSLGALQMIRGNRDEAESAFKQAAAMAPDSPQGYLALANFYWTAGQQDQAEAQLKKAWAANPKDELVNRALGYFYMGTGRPAEAEAPLRTLDALLKAMPGSPVVQTEFGRLQLSKKNRAEARSAFERALSKDPNFVDAPSALTRMGHRGEASGRRQSARRSGRRAERQRRASGDAGRRNLRGAGRLWQSGAGTPTGDRCRAGKSARVWTAGAGVRIAEAPTRCDS
jgi:Tfp pilus assembly protein PilF